MGTNPAVHTFSNGVKVYTSHLTHNQLTRYAIHNVHEYPEDIIFTHLIHSLPPDAYYVNLGSGFGYYPILAWLLRSDLAIYAYEPLPLHHRYILENIALNRINPTGLTLIQKAVSTDVGPVDFLDMNYGSHITMTADYACPTWAKQTQVDATRLDDIVTQLGVVHLLHMDIQGHEYVLLSDFLQRMTPLPIRRIFVATHGAETHYNCIHLFCHYNHAIELATAPRDYRDGYIVACAV